MKSLCGADCANCQWNSTCPGCSDEKCFIAKYIKLDGKEAYEECADVIVDVDGKSLEEIVEQITDKKKMPISGNALIKIYE